MKAGAMALWGRFGDSEFQSAGALGPGREVWLKEP